MKFVISAGGLARRLEAPFNVSGTKEDLHRLKTAIEDACDNRFTDRAWLSVDVIEPPFVGDERFADAAPWLAGPEGIPVDADFAEVCADRRAEQQALVDQGLGAPLRREVHVGTDSVRVTESDAKERRQAERRRASPPADSDHSCARPGDPGLERFREWWYFQTTKGDPQRRAHLTEDAYMSAHMQGRIDEVNRMRSRVMVTSGASIEALLRTMIGAEVLHAMSASTRVKMVDFGWACMKDAVEVKP